MQADHQDFIGVYQSVYPDEFCQHLINEFERYAGQGSGTNRQDGEGAARHVKDDHQIFCNGKNLEFEPFIDAEGNRHDRVVDLFFEGLQACYNAYAEKYSVILNGDLRTNTMKMQRTKAGGGYHVWHGEQGNGEHAGRGLVYMLYLNSLTPEQAGETEFLYQQRKVRPQANTMVLWPAAFTHAHRGNPVWSDGVKYIVTGWFKYD